MGVARLSTPVVNGFRSVLAKAQILFAETFGWGPGATLGAIIFTALVLIMSVFWFFYSAPPTTIIMTSGDEGSVFKKNAERYAKILERNGVTLKILPSEGSLENLERLADPSFRVDVGFVQTGVAKGFSIDRLVSLGSISYAPLFIFYRSPQPVDLLSQFSGKRLAIGEDGTGTQILALDLLSRNDITFGGTTALLKMDDDEAQEALLAGSIDAAFMMGDSASTQVMRSLLRTPGIRLFDFTQADAYTRRMGYLNKVVLLKGAIDFGRNIPDHDVHLVSPTVEVIAREDLHPALSDLLIEAAMEVHGRQGMYQRKGEFPALLDHEYRISADAQRYHKSGKRFLYRYFPFWLASLINRFLVVFIPLVLILIPGLRAIPSIYRWRMKLQILRWYRALLAIEAELTRDISPEMREELLRRLNHMEQTANQKKKPALFADQFYALRVHIRLVRERLMGYKG
jgi:hypothetical protein